MAKPKRTQIRNRKRLRSLGQSMLALENERRVNQEDNAGVHSREFNSRLRRSYVSLELTASRTHLLLRQLRRERGNGETERL